MNKKEKQLYQELKNHIKIVDIITHKKKDDILFTCEVDRIQSISRSIISRILKKYGKYQISSTNKKTKNLGFTKVVIYREKDAK